MADDTTSLDWKNLPLVLVHPETTSFSDLPGDVATDILARLPVKTLIRSTAVSKKWNSLIKNRSFIKAHLAHSLAKLSAINETGTNNDGTNGNGCILLAPKPFSEKPICSIFYDDKSYTPHSTLKIPFETDSKTLKIVGSCNGLVCLTDEADYAFGGEVYLYNPCVQKYRKLSDEFSCFVDWMGKAGSAYPVLGFGYHEAEKDYRVVRIIYSFHNVFPKIRPRSEVYSMREKKWRSVKAQINTTAYRGCCAFLDGCIYWVAAEKPRQRITTVMWFDLNDEVFHEVGMPQDYDKDFTDDYLPLPVNIMRWNDAVSVCVVEPRKGNGVRCVFWVLKKDDGGEISWKNQLKLVLAGDLCGMPVGFTWTGKLVVDAINRGKRASGCSKTAVLNLKDLKFQDLALDGPHTVDTHFLESLVLFLE